MADAVQTSLGAKYALLFAYTQMLERMAENFADPTAAALQASTLARAMAGLNEPANQK